MPFFYEATGGESYRKGGVPGSSIFTVEAMEYIRKFENDVKNLPSFSKVCFQTQFDGVNQNPCEGMFLTPITLSFSTENIVPSYGLDCCVCNSTDSCVASPLCAPHNTSHVSLHVLDENTDCSLESGVMNRLHDALDCESPSIPGAKQLGELVDQHFLPTHQSRTTRSMLKAGGKVSLLNVAPEDQWDRVRDEWTDTFYPEFKNFVIDELIPLMDEFNDGGPVRVASITQAHLEYEIVVLGLGTSIKWMAISMVVTLAYMWFHTRSLFLTLAGFGHIMISFPVAFFFYTCIFQIKYFGFLNAIGFFVILGIGADDIFVFVDAWKQSLHDGGGKSLEERMNRTYRRAAKAMLITSITDACAFYANAFSSITVVRIFGVFMGTMVCFLSLLIFLSVSLLIFLSVSLFLHTHTHTGDLQFCSCCYVFPRSRCVLESTWLGST